MTQTMHTTTAQQTTTDADTLWATADPTGSVLVTFALVALIPVALLAAAYPVAAAGGLLGVAVGLAAG